MHSDQDIEAAFGKLPIRHLVYVTEGFVVFVDNEWDVDWRTAPAYDAEHPKDKPAQHEVLNIAATIETTPCQYLDDAAKLSFKRLVGEGIARALHEDYPNAKKSFAKARRSTRWTFEPGQTGRLSSLTVAARSKPLRRATWCSPKRCARAHR